MSSTEFHTGKLKKIDMGPYENETLKEKVTYLTRIGHEITYVDIDDDYIESDTIVKVNGMFYEILDHVSARDEQDIMEATENPDGTISFILQFYNGGCGFEEALECALEETIK